MLRSVAARSGLSGLRPRRSLRHALAAAPVEEAGKGQGRGQRRSQDFRERRLVLAAGSGVVAWISSWLFWERPAYRESGVKDRVRACIWEAYRQRIAFRDLEAAAAALDWAEAEIKRKDELEKRRRDYEIEEGPEWHRILIDHAGRVMDAKGDLYLTKATEPDYATYSTENYQRALTFYSEASKHITKEVEPRNARHAAQLNLEKVLLRVKQAEGVAALGELADAARLLREQLAHLRTLGSAPIDCEMPPIIWAGDVYVMPSLDSAQAAVAVCRSPASMLAFVRERLSLLLLRSVPAKWEKDKELAEETRREYAARLAEGSLLADLSSQALDSYPPEAPETAHGLIAQREIADELWRLGNFAAAESLVRAAIRRARGADSAGGHVDPVASQLLCELYCRLARLELDQGRKDDAVLTSKRALQMVQFRPLFDANHLRSYRFEVNDFVDYIVLRATGRKNPITPGPTGDYARHHRYT